MPVELERIVSKALRKNRDERYQTIKDMLLDLKALKQELEFERKLDRSIQPTSAGAAATSQRSGGTTSESATRQTIPEHGFADSLLFKRNALIAVVAVLLIVSVAGGYWFFTRSSNEAISSIAVLPFVNASGNSELEYLSDGMTDSLINSLSQLPNISVKARSSVFHYKGTDIDPQKLAADLSVQAILSGRVVQRVDDLTLYLSLVDGRNGNQIWGEQYNRKSADLVSLQTEIAREVSRKLQARLSRADEQRLTKHYPANPEAYQLYLKGRYYLLKGGAKSDVLTGISYFQKAIEIDPSYAMAYVGLADAYRSPTLEIRSTEDLPKAKTAALKAIELDDTLADGHAVLGWVHFWYDWDWSSAESQFKRALELDENNADAHSYYAHLLSNTGRHAEALAEAKRARELEPLNSRINAFEGLVLIFAGQVDAGIDRLQKTLELYPNQYGARNILAAGYIQKKKFPEAAAEARKAIDVSPTASDAKSSLAYALAKEGKTAEARAVVEDLVRISNQRYVPGYSIANAFNGLGDREKALAWLERGFQEHDVRLIFLKVDPKWNNLRSEPRFQDLMRRVGLQ